MIRSLYYLEQFHIHVRLWYDLNYMNLDSLHIRVRVWYDLNFMNIDQLHTNVRCDTI